MPHVLIKYAYVLICISAGEGSQHFSAFYLVKLAVAGAVLKGNFQVHVLKC